MAPPRSVSNMALHLNNAAAQLEKEAANLRKIAKMTTAAFGDIDRPDAENAQKLKPFYDAAHMLADLPVVDIRQHARNVAKDKGLPVEPVKILAQRIRANNRSKARSARDLAIIRTYASGLSYTKTAHALNVSRRTVITTVKAARESGLFDSARPERLQDPLGPDRPRAADQH